MQKLGTPFLDILNQSDNILIAGAGGGFDIFCGLPLFHHLKSLGKQVHLANLTFSNLYHASNESKLGEYECAVINADTSGSTQYFPEKFLSEWLKSKGIEQSIYAFYRTGVKPLTEAYQHLVRHLNIETIVLIDGGCDSLMRGDENGLGTPEEDIASLLAAEATDAQTKMLISLGFGVDYFHGVCHAQFLEAVSALSQTEDFLGTLSITVNMDAAAFYQQACDFVHSKMENFPSIVNTSILAAIEGQYGDFHATERTRDSTLWINPLMSMYWGFNLQGVTDRCLYKDRVINTETWQDINLAIEAFRKELTTSSSIKPWIEMMA